MTRIAVGRPAGVRRRGGRRRPTARRCSRKPEAAVAEAIACVRQHQRDGDVVVVATGCEETLARGFLAAVGLGDLDVVGSTGRLWPPRVRRAMGESKVAHARSSAGIRRRGRPPTATARRTCRCSPARPRPVLVNADEQAARAGRAHPGPPSRDPHLALTAGGAGAPSLEPMTAPRPGPVDLSALATELLEKAATAPARRAVAHPGPPGRRPPPDGHGAPGRRRPRRAREPGPGQPPGAPRPGADRGRERLGRRCAPARSRPVPMTRHGLHADEDSVVLLSVAIEV